jgi:Cytochrome P450
VTVNNDYNTNVSSSSSSKRETVTLPAGTFACIWIYSLHRNPEFWQKSDTFWPERWLERDDGDHNNNNNNEKGNHAHTQQHVLDKGITNGAFMPFAVGPRNCVGQPLAYMILRTLLARLLQRFEFRDARCSDCGNSSSRGSRGSRGSSSIGSVSVDGTNGHATRSRTSSLCWSVDNPEAYLKDMQAGFTVLPQNGVKLAIYNRETLSS